MQEQDEEKKPTNMRLPVSVMDRVRRMAKLRRMTVTGFVELAILEKLEVEEKAVELKKLTV